MKVVFAPDKFAGTLTAAEAAAAMALGWRRTRPDDELLEVPMADGGEGTLDVLTAAVPGARRQVVEVADALGHPVEAAWLLLPSGRAFVEAAQAVGLSRTPSQRRDPLRATSYGVGQLLLAAVAGAPEGVVIGLGGSATVDGGAGLMTALGFRLLRADGNGLKVGARWLPDVDRAVRGPAPGTHLVIAADVSNPLLGPGGAAAVFGPQKGADADGVAELERGLTRLADVVERDLPGGPWRDVPGAGAAGGLGWALMAALWARMASGAQVVGELVGLERALEGADVVVTGEGALDAQSADGKCPMHVTTAARRHGAQVLAVAGRIQDGAGLAYDAVAELGPQGMERAAELVAARTAVLAAAHPGRLAG